MFEDDTKTEDRGLMKEYELRPYNNDDLWISIDEDHVTISCFLGDAIRQQAKMTERYLCQHSASEFLRIAGNLEILAELVRDQYGEWKSNEFK